MCLVPTAWRKKDRQGGRAEKKKQQNIWLDRLLQNLFFRQTLVFLKTKKERHEKNRWNNKHFAWCGWEAHKSVIAVLPPVLVHVKKKDVKEQRKEIDVKRTENFPPCSKCVENWFTLKLQGTVQWSFIWVTHFLGNQISLQIDWQFSRWSWRSNSIMILWCKVFSAQTKFGSCTIWSCCVIHPHRVHLPSFFHKLKLCICCEVSVSMEMRLILVQTLQQPGILCSLGLCQSKSWSWSGERSFLGFTGSLLLLWPGTYFTLNKSGGLSFTQDNFSLVLVLHWRKLLYFTNNFSGAALLQHFEWSCSLQEASLTGLTSNLELSEAAHIEASFTDLHLEVQFHWELFHLELQFSHTKDKLRSLGFSFAGEQCYDAFVQILHFMLQSKEMVQAKHSSLDLLNCNK